VYNTKEDEYYRVLKNGTDPFRYPTFQKAYAYGDYGEDDYRTYGYWDDYNDDIASKVLREYENRVPITMETFTYTVNRYETYLNELREDVEERCKKLNIDFKQFEDIFDKRVEF
jgi:hypothetical protein